MVTLEVFNTLDCLNFIRKFTFRSYYNITDATEEIERFGQCIETVRQTLTCYGDISLNTYAWRKNRRLPFPDFRIDHECRDWNSIQKWTEDHRLPPLGDEMLEHPTFGMLQFLPSRDIRSSFVATGTTAVEPSQED